LDRAVHAICTLFSRLWTDIRTTTKKKGNAKKRHVTLQMLAERVGLTKGTCSAVLNKSAASQSVPRDTQTRILRAARELNYRPSFYARNLGVKRSYMIGVVTQEIGDFYGSPSSAALKDLFGEEITSFLQWLYAMIPSYWKPIHTF
jgi:hypothetical protein